MKRRGTIQIGRGLQPAARVVLGLTFLYAGAMKIASPAEFARSILAFELFPLAMVSPVTIVVPWIELAAALALLLLPSYREAAAVVLLSLLLAFLGLFAITLLRGVSVDCGCFGAGGPFGGSIVAALARNVALGGAALLVIHESHHGPIRGREVAVQS